MWQNYFEYDGTKYYTGTQIRILKYPYDNPAFNDIAYFIYYDTEYDVVWYKMAYTWQNKGCSMQMFLKEFGGATGKVDTSIHVPQKNQLKDNQIPKLFIGWIWYITIMIILVIFKDRILGWFFTSVVFFSWRKNVIKKEGTYVER